jgi:hypothetical protein
MDTLLLTRIWIRNSGRLDVMGVFQIGRGSPIVVEELIPFSLVFEGFSLEFDIRVQRSIAETRAFQRGKPPDFAFVVSDIWLNSGSWRCLVISEFNTGNLIEALRELSAARSLPKNWVLLRASLLGVVSARGCAGTGIGSTKTARWQRTT